MNDATCGFLRSGEAIPLSRLFQFTDIGSDSTHPSVAYPEAASVTAFLIEEHGIEKFRGLGLDDLDRAWRAWLSCAP